MFETVSLVLMDMVSADAARSEDVPPESIWSVGVRIFPATSRPLPSTANLVSPFATTRTPVTGSMKIPVPVKAPGVV